MFFPVVFKGYGHEFVKTEAVGTLILISGKEVKNLPWSVGMPLYKAQRVWDEDLPLALLKKKSMSVSELLRII